MNRVPDHQRGDAFPSPERWSVVRALAEELLDTEPAARAAFLDAACADDDALREMVTRMAEACETTDAGWGFLARPAGVLAEGLIEEGRGTSGAGDAPPPEFFAALADRYAVRGEVGRGGMAIVYAADDLKHDRSVALKVLHWRLGEMLGAQRFLSEIRVTARLQHPNLVPLFDSGEAAGQLYYVMPLIQGPTLRARLRADGRLPVDEAVAIVRTIAGALDYAHRQGVVHRDLKPENVLFQDGQPLVADFGISLAIRNSGDERLTSAGPLGTPQYMSPEQADAAATIDRRSDVYTLACLLYELLAGDPPLTGPSALAAADRVLAQRPARVRTLRPDVPPEIDEAIARALSRLPEERHPTARAFGDSLGHALPTDVPVAATGTAGDAPPGSHRPPRPWRLPVLAAFLTVASIVGVALWRGLPATLASQGRRLVVVPLENRSTTSAFPDPGEYAAAEIARWISGEVTIEVVPASSVRDVVRLLDSSSNRPAPAAVVARRTGASHVVTVAISVIGPRARIEIEFIDARADSLMLRLEPISGPADSLDALIRVASQRAAAAALVLLTPERLSWRAFYTVPPTIEAYYDYFATFDLFCQGRFPETIATADRVLANTPDFVPVMNLVRFAYWNLGLTRQADSVHMQLEKLRYGMTREERLEHDWMGGSMDGDVGKATRNAEAMYRIDPTSKYGFAAGFTAFRSRNASAALTRFLKVDIDLPCQREWVPWWTYTTAAYHMLGRYDDELALARRGVERFPEQIGLYDAELRAWAARGDIQAIDSLLTILSERPPVPGASFGARPLVAALELREHGYPAEVDRLLRQSVDWFGGRPASEARADRGQAFLATGRWADADTLFAALAAAATAVNSIYIGYLGERGFALAHLGEVDSARAVLRQLGQAYEPHVMAGYAGAGRAAITAALGDTEQAIALLDEAYRNGYPYGVSLHETRWWDPLRSIATFTDVIRPR